MYYRKAPKFDITDHPDILAALARMEQEAYARGRADALAIARDSLEDVAIETVPGLARGAWETGIRYVIEHLEA